MYCLICKHEIGEFGFTDKRSHEEGCSIYANDEQVEKELGDFINAYKGLVEGGNNAEESGS